MKPCIKCGAVDRNRLGKCRPCTAAYRARYKAENAEKIKAQAAEYRDANREALRAKSADYYAANKEACLQRTSAWSAKNLDNGRMRAARYRAANPDKVAAYESANRAKNGELLAHRARLYYAKNKHKIYERRRASESYRASNHDRRAAKRSSGKLSRFIAVKLYALQKGKCACGCRMPLGNKYHIDHIMPLALGGPNMDSNVQLLRAECNLRKGAKHPVDYMQSKGFLI